MNQPMVLPSMMDKFVASYSHHGVFAPDLIVTLRKNDNMVTTLEELCKIIGDSMKPNIEYLGYDIVDHRIKYPTNFVQMYDSDIYCVEFKFKIVALDKTGEVATTYKKMVFEVPTLIDGEYYYINGNRFYPIYQLLDATTYHKDDSVTLKTLMLPIKLTRSPTIITDCNGKQYSSYIMTTDMQKKKINMFAFFFATLGFFKTIRFFEGPTPLFHVVSEDKVDLKSTEFTYFQISKKVFLRIQTQHVTSNINVRTVIACILSVCNKKVGIEDIKSVDYWRYTVLSSYFVKSKNYKNTKIDLFIESYKRLYDSITKENMANFEEPKENIYEVMRWMFINFTKLLYRDNSSIYNKRTRLSEYQIAPIVRRIMTKMHRVIHCRDRSKTNKKFEEILTLPFKYSPDARDKRKMDYSSDFLIKSIVNSNNTKYADCVNDMNLFNITLKWTLNAPSTTVTKSPKGNSLTINQRAQSPTFIGYISLNTSGAGDPGGTGCFTPFVKLFNGFFRPPVNTESVYIEE